MTVALTSERSTLSELTRNWDFVASQPDLRMQARRFVSALTGYSAAPRVEALIPVTPRERWLAYFVFAERGGMTAAHRYTLQRLRNTSGGVLTIYAAPRPRDVPSEIIELSDAVYWKGLSGFDFSAYSLALREVATRSPGADLFAMNDSVLGPLADLTPILDRPQWDLTGFTATYLGENHLQSYAFLVQAVTPAAVGAFGSAMPRRLACNRYRDVVRLQETRFARLAARHMSVGALWYAGESAHYNPTLSLAAELVDNGFPFLKRSLLSRYADFQDRGRVADILVSAGHPH